MSWMSPEKQAYIATHIPAPLVATPPPEPEYLYRSVLLRRGWTATLITTILGDHDLNGVNPHYKSGPSTRLYLRTRVEAAEASEAFREAQKGREKRRAGAKQAVTTKTQRIKAEIEALSITLPVLGEADLIEYAVENRNRAIPDWVWEKEDVQLASVSSISCWPAVDAFRDRICVNYLRHELTKYDTILHRIAGRVAKREAHRMLSRKIFDAIGAAYPMLKAEAERQYKSKWEGHHDR